MKRTLSPALLALTLTATACTAASDPVAEPSDSSTSSTTSPDDIDVTNTREPDNVEEPSGGSRPVGFARAALRQFDECGAFLDYVHTEGAERVGAYGFGSNGWFGFDDVVMVAEEAMTDDMAEATTAEGELPRSTAAPSETVPVRTKATMATVASSRPPTCRSKVSTNPTSSRPTATG